MSPFFQNIPESIYYKTVKSNIRNCSISGETEWLKIAASLKTLVKSENVVMTSQAEWRQH
jgi:hypothetical protein